MASDGASDPRGSLWRRWDPHLHLPGTLLNDQFGSLTVSAALDIIASRSPTIEVLGVTDYFTTASFRRALLAWGDGAGASIRYLFPNVELRLDVPTMAGSGVNLHLVASADDVDELDRFLGMLEFSYDGRKFRVTDEDLIALGRAYRADKSLDEVAARAEGAKQFKVNASDFHDKYGADRWARERCLVALAGGSNDGSSGVRSGDGGFGALRQTIERFTHIIFSSNPQQARFWLGDGADDQQRIENVYGSLKPCLHGSDAHHPERLGVPDEDRFTWLKGDASFDTLRMACLTPETRASISPISPANGYSRGRLTEVSVDDPQWFPQGAVPINPGLVAIIGARGSGKTALADLIAAGAGSREPALNARSFVRRAGRLLDGVVTTTSWGADVSSSCSFPASIPDEDDQESVRYLSQQFVERLCSADGVSDELLVEIERVVFNACPVDDRQGATNFRELLDIRLGAAHSRQTVEREAIAEISESLTEQRVIKDSLPRKRSELEDLRKQLEPVEAQTKELTSQTDPTSAARLVVVNEILEARQQELQQLGRRITELDALRGEVASFRSARFQRYLAKLREDHEAANLTDDQWQAFSIDYTGDVDGVISDALSLAQGLRSTVAGVTIEPEVGTNLGSLALEELHTKTVAELTHERSRIQRLVGLDAQRTKALAKLNATAAGFRTRIVKLEAEIANESRVDERIAELGQQRVESYAQYFDALLDEEVELRDLYSPLGGVLSEIGQSVAKLQFSVRRTVDIDEWAAVGEELFDLRYRGTFQGHGELARVAQAELFDALAAGDGERASSAIRDFSAKHSSAIRKQSNVDASDLDAWREWERRVSRWLYSADHVGISYSLEYDGLNIERLSPGTRGIVLLLLYLAVDQEDIEPLIIDQPEENLDPESVYSELVNLFRSASERRQIVMVTHNANLVVNTDVDQVIVAHCGVLEEGRLPEMRYLSGGLENPEVRAAVCEVLEGGEEAFRQRARRLQIELALR